MAGKRFKHGLKSIFWAALGDYIRFIKMVNDKKDNGA